MERVSRYDDYDYEVAENDDFDLDFDLKDTGNNVINMNPEQVLEQEIQREKTLRETLLKLMSRQALLLKANAVNSTRKTRMKIDNIMKGIEVCEKDYIVSRDVKKSAIKGYKDSLKKFEIVHKIQTEDKLKEITKYEDKQHEAMNEKSAAISEKKKMQASKEYKKYLQDIKKLKNEINLAIEEDNDEEIAIKRQELKELKRRNPTIRCDRKIEEANNAITEMENKISKAKAYLAKLEEKKYKELDEIVKTKDEALSLAKQNQNFWQKLVGSIFNKFHKTGKIANSLFEKLGALDAKMREESKKIIEEHDKQQEEKDKVRADRAQEKAQARAQVKAAREEAIRKHKEEIIKSIEGRIAEKEKQLEAIRAQSAQYNGRNMTPALAGGNGNIVQFERD